MPQRDKILVVSRDPHLADVRRKVLETAGYEVLSATDSQSVRKICADHNLRLVMVGHSVSPAEKRRVWAEVREHRNLPLLELHRSGPELMEAAFFHQSVTPDDFLMAVMRILQTKRRFE
jgi:DNA-binding response OmpR family regulator